MQVVQSKKELEEVLQVWKSKNCSIGLVPTMGALHQGHLSLVKRALSDNDYVVVSIFVNPTQFDNSEDLDKYPSNLKRDVALLLSISKEVVIFTPGQTEIYDGNIASKTFNFNGLEKVMEGEFRTGHFDGVATIVELLFKAVEPTRAYFGEKDFQQLQIILKLVEQSNLNLEIIPCPIEREPNGLARSSRNERLSQSTRKAAGFIHETLLSAKTKFGMENATSIKDWVSKRFNENPFFELEYFEITDVDTLTPITKIQKNRKYRAFVAVYAEGIRLIDNIALN
ncbi:MAG: pantoate--beta-alanine ligase [Bacteroidota bacterium]